MANTRGSIRTPSGELVFKLVGSILDEGHGMSVYVCVVADSRMSAVLKTRSFGVLNARVEVDDPPDSETAMLAANSPDGAIWTEWFGPNEWSSIGTLPGRS